MLSYDDFVVGRGPWPEVHSISTASLRIRLAEGAEAFEPIEPPGRVAEDRLREPGLVKAAPTGEAWSSPAFGGMVPVTAWTGDLPLSTQLLEPAAWDVLESLGLWTWWGNTELDLMSRANTEHPHHFRTDIWAHAGCVGDINGLLAVPLNVSPSWIRVRGAGLGSILVYLGHRWNPVHHRDADGQPIDMEAEHHLWAKESKRAAYRLLAPSAAAAEGHRLVDRMSDGAWWGKTHERWGA